ncbi:Hsp70 family protein [Nostoc sp. ChiVER01]|uniref:Hsp70 family protein n=1 Tax=Nostoc sp. ChiVER01 TaxID=3075382 RepID=UPI002AD21A2E|nr:Hsp70 family protein [Nostoc sp. ChiVER01]MDZ8226576.1 Hsp70 family protein [Nostoc sp. ChiVER01]
MTNQFAIGIDLGTSTSEICVFRDGQPYSIPDPGTKIPIIPSIFAINPKGQFLVGESARNRVDLEAPKGVKHGIREVKRQMGTSGMIELLGEKYRPEEISEKILRKLRDNAEEALGETIQEVVLSVPANFDNAARQATLDAAKLAGLKIIRLINEPTAAALAFGFKNIDVEEQLVVFDFGGGTLDITVLEMISGLLDVKCSFGDRYLGGKDFDEKLIELILRKFQEEYPNIQISENSQRALKGEAEKTKIILSAHRSHTAHISNFAVRSGEPIDLDVEVTREEFERAIEPLLQRARECLQQVLNAKQLKPSAIDRVLLVGGTTYIPAVRQLLAEFFGKEPKSDVVNPDLAVSIGASIEAAIRQGLIKEDTGIIMTDVSPFGLGIEVQEVDKHGKPIFQHGKPVLKYDSLIQPNTTIPYITTKLYSLLHTEQESVKIHLYQDHLGKAELSSEAIDTEIVGVIEDIPKATNGVPYPVEVNFSYDNNGLVKLKATIPDINKSLEITYERPFVFSGNMTDKQIEKAIERGNITEANNGTFDEFEGLLKSSKRLIKNLHEPESSRLTQAVTKLENALTSGNTKEIEKSSKQLVNLNFDLRK